jgi:hypothetical protein
MYEICITLKHFISLLDSLVPMIEGILILNNMEEIWKDINDWNGVYQISNLGNVKSKRSTRHKILKGCIDTGGYKYVALCKDCKRTFKWIQRLVAIHFIENPLGLHDVNHIDGDRKNNKITNLEWVNRRENVSHGNFLRNSDKKYIGIYQNKSGRWASKIWVNGESKSLGTFNTDIEANMAYQNYLQNNLMNNKYSSNQ